VRCGCLLNSDWWTKYLLKYVIGTEINYSWDWYRKGAESLKMVRVN